MSNNVKKINIDSFNFCIGNINPNDLPEEERLELNPGDIYVNLSENIIYKLNSNLVWKHLFSDTSEIIQESSITFKVNNKSYTISVENINENIKLKLPSTKPQPNQILTALNEEELSWSSVTNESDSKIYVDSIVLNSGFLPEEINQRLFNSGLLWSRFSIIRDQIKNYYFDIEIYNSENDQLVNSYKDLRFKNLSELSDWIRNNNLFVPFGGPYGEERSVYYFIINFYEKEKKNIKRIITLRGYNKFFHGLIGSRKRVYEENPKTARLSRISNRNKLFYDFYRYAFPNNKFIQEKLTENDFEKIEYVNTIWCSYQKDTLYGTPRIGSRFVQYPSERVFLDVENDKIVNIEKPTSCIFGTPKIFISTSNSQNVSYAGFWILPNQEIQERNNIELSNPGSTSSWITIQDNKEYQIRNFFLENNFSSGILVYPVTSQENKNLVSVFIKPIGIDHVSFDYFDESLYDIEAVFFDENRRQYKSVDMTNLVIRKNKKSNQCVVSISSMINSFGLVTRNRKKKHGGHIKTDRIYLRLREKESRDVGELSKGYISGNYSGFVLPYRFLIQPDK